MALALIGAGISALGNIFGGKSRKKAAKAEAARIERENTARALEVERAVAAETERVAADRSNEMARLSADNSRINDEALQNESRLFAMANDGINALEMDQQSAIALRQADESRLKEATGIDMVKLVADSQAAGFNPLTVLNATGAAGYDRRGAVLTTPFVGKAEGFFRKMENMGNAFANRLSASVSGAASAASAAQYGMGLSGSAAQYGMGLRASTAEMGASLRAGAGQAVAQSAGYVGDAMAGFGQSMFSVGQQRTQMRHETAMQNASFADAARARSAIYGGGQPAGSKGRVAPLVAPTVATGPMNVAGAGAIPVKVMTANGPAYLRRDAADAFGVVDGQWIGGDMYTQILGEGAGEVRAVADVIFGEGPFVQPTRPQRRPSYANRPVNSWANPQPDFSGAM